MTRDPRPTPARAVKAPPHRSISLLSARRVLRCAAVSLAVILCVPVRAGASAGQLSFAWDYTASGAAGFALYCGSASGTYTLRFDAGDARTYTVSGLTSGARYYCAVTAYDSSKAEGAFSTEASVVVPNAPVGGFKAAPTSGITPLNVVFTNTTTGSAIAWAWDFGDGDTSTLKNPGHSYSAPGTYTVKLTAFGPGGSSIKTATIKADPLPAPVANFTVRPSSGIAPLVVKFANTTAGRVDSWEWDFGDGTRSSDVKSPVHTYNQPGSYTVKLTATNSGGTSIKTAATPITANPPPVPVANFTMAPAHGDAPLAVRFRNRTVGKVDSWLWDFGDNSTSTDANPSHVYAQAGSYSVKLSATNVGGTGTKTSVTPIVVTLPPLPVANFSVTPASGHLPLTVYFINRTSGKMNSWLWDFGDGTTSTDVNPTHVYTEAGKYTVTLSATEFHGTATATSATAVRALHPGRAPAHGFEKASGTKVADLSVKGDTGVIFGATRVPSGKFGRALSFDRIKNWDGVATSPTLNLTADVTPKAWVSLTSSTTG